MLGSACRLWLGLRLSSPDTLQTDFCAAWTCRHCVPLPSHDTVCMGVYSVCVPSTSDRQNLWICLSLEPLSCWWPCLKPLSCALLSHRPLSMPPLSLPPCVRTPLATHGCDLPPWPHSPCFLTRHSFLLQNKTRNPIYLYLPHWRVNLCPSIHCL